MAHHKSAIKRIRQTEIRTERNRSVRTRVKNVVRDFRDAVNTNDAEAAELLRKAIVTISTASSKGVIPAKRASRKISRLTKQLNLALAQAQA